jgi:acyl carrier protein
MTSRNSRRATVRALIKRTTPLVASHRRRDVNAVALQRERMLSNRSLDGEIASTLMSVHVTLDQLREIMWDVFDDDGIVPTEAMTAEDVEGWDSLSHIRLMVSIEKQFKIKFTNAEVEKLLNVGDLLKVINSKV